MIELLPPLDAGGWAVVLIAVVMAGLVRGFSGFGTAMIYLPLAGMVLDPFILITAMVVMDLIGPLPNVPRALRDGDMRQLAMLVGGMIVGLPFGVAFLLLIDPLTFRWLVSILIFLLLALLLAGARYHGPGGPKLVIGAGFLGGLAGGAVGIAGPPIILLYMASRARVSMVRANITLLLILTDVALLVAYGVSGKLLISGIMLGAVIALPYLLANVLGARAFDPGREGMYRSAAYVIIAVSAVLGLPLFS